MQITLVFTYASGQGQEYAFTVDSYRLFRVSGKIQFKIGDTDDEYSLEPGDRVDIYAVGYTTTMKRNKV